MSAKNQKAPYFIKLMQEKQETLLAARKKDLTGSLLFTFRTSGQEKRCEMCTAMEGKTETLNDLIKIDAIPPLHPNCRCRIEVAPLFSPSSKSVSAPAAFELRHEQGTTKLDTAESQYIMSVQLRL